MYQGKTQFFTVPDGVYKVKFSVSERKNYNVFDATESKNKLAYEEYEEKISKKTIPLLDFEMFSHSAFENRKLPIESFEETVRSINMLDLSKCEQGIMDVGSYGTHGYNANYKVSDYVHLRAGTKYCFTQDLRNSLIHIYDTALRFLEEKRLSLITIPNKHFEYTPDSDCYVRICCGNNNMEKAMIVEGDVYPTEYVPYLCKIKKSAIYGLYDDVFDSYLPSHIYIASGRTLELYNIQVFLQADKYHIQWSTNIGIQMKDKLVINTNDSLIGNKYTVTFNAYDDNLNVVLSKSTEIEVVDSNISDVVNVLAVGDSLTQKPWIAELQNLSDEKLNFIGREPYSIRDSDGNMRTGGCEGVSGWTSNMHPSSTASPFYNSEDGTWSLSHYIDTYLGGVTPDLIMYWTGTNGLQLNPSQNVDGMIDFVNMVRTEYPNIPILVTNTIYRSNQDGIGRQSNVDGYSATNTNFKYSEDLKVIRLANAVYDKFKSYDNLLVIPSVLAFDSVNGFGWMELNANSRSDEKIKVPMDSVHPQPSGYYQIADIDLAYICKLLSTIN